VACLGFSRSPAAFPEARKGRVGLVARGIDSGVAKLCSNLKEQGSFADLPGTREKLNAARRRFLEAFKDSLTAYCIIIRYVNHTRIIIRLHRQVVNGLSRQKLPGAADPLERTCARRAAINAR
jgi:hypothetical protein